MAFIPNVTSVDHLDSEGKLLFSRNRAEQKGRVKVTFSNTDHFEGVFVGKFGTEDHFRGIVYFKNTNFIDWFEGLVVANEHYVMKVKKGTMHFKDKATYDGDFDDGKRDGYGVYRWSADERYEGYWKAGSQTHGTHFYPTGNRYEGDYNDKAQKHGYGVFYFPSGEVRFGNWVNDFLQDGRNIYANGNAYEGTFMGDSGATRKYGVFYFRANNNGKYEGFYNDQGRLHGQGTWYFPDGQSLSGNWVNATLTYGKLTYPSGEVFEGTIDSHNSRQRVDGTLTFPNGHRFTGAFKNELPDGKGTYEYANGDVFEGFFEKGKKSGIGKFIRANGDLDYGEWRDDVRIDEDAT